MREYLEAGKVINIRGLAGELKVVSYCDSPQSLCSFERVFLDKDGKDMRRVLSAKVYKEFVYLKIEGVDNADSASLLKNRIIYINRNDMVLGENSVFIDDIIDMPVIDIDTGVRYGVLKEVFNVGASDIYRIKDGQKEYLIPAVNDIVIKIDIENGIFIRPIPGLIDNAEEIR